MAKHFTIAVTGGDDFDPTTSGALHKTVAGVCNYLKGAAGGARPTNTTLVVEGAAVKASGTVEIVGFSGAVAVTVNGVSVYSATPASAAAGGAAITAAITGSANPLVSELVTASDDGAGTVTITAKQAGFSGNAITIAITGTNTSASGARLTGGTSTKSTYSL